MCAHFPFADIIILFTKFYISCFLNAKLRNYKKISKPQYYNHTKVFFAPLMHLKCVTNKFIIFNRASCCLELQKAKNWLGRQRGLNRGHHQRYWKEAAEKVVNPLHLLLSFTCLSQGIHMIDWNCVWSQAIIPQPRLETAPCADVFSKALQVSMFSRRWWGRGSDVLRHSWNPSVQSLPDSPKWQLFCRWPWRLVAPAHGEALCASLGRGLLNISEWQCTAQAEHSWLMLSHVEKKHLGEEACLQNIVHRYKMK